MPEHAALKRLHPLSLVFMIASAARSLILPGLLVLVFSSEDQTEVWFMLLFLPSVAVGVVRYLTLSYELERDELVLREGLVFKKVRHVPYARIQNVDTEQGPVQRFFGVTVVRIETAGGSEPEALLRVLKLDRVEELRRHVFADHGAAPAARPDDGSATGGPGEARRDPDEAEADDGEPVRPLFRLGPKEIVLYGLADNRGSALVAAALGLAWQLNLEDRIEGLFESVQNGFGAFELTLLIGGFLAGTRLLSILWAFANLSDFRLARRGEDLRASRGLWTRRTFTIPRHRIQTVSVRSTWLLRRLGRVSVLVETAGGQEVSDRELSRSVLVPIAPAGEVGGIVREVEPAAWPTDPVWRRVHPRARRRLAVRALAIVGGATGFVALVASPWALASLPISAAAGLLWARRRASRLGYALTPDAVFLRDGVWTQRQDAVRHSKIQTVRLQRSPFDRRHGMASVVVDTAATGPLPQRFCVPYLDERIARALARLLAARAGATPFRW